MMHFIKAWVGLLCKPSERTRRTSSQKIVFEEDNESSACFAFGRSATFWLRDDSWDISAYRSEVTDADR